MTIAKSGYKTIAIATNGEGHLPIMGRAMGTEAMTSESDISRTSARGTLGSRPVCVCPREHLAPGKGEREKEEHGRVMPKDKYERRRCAQKKKDDRRTSRKKYIAVAGANVCGVTLCSPR